MLASSFIVTPLEQIFIDNLDIFIIRPIEKKLEYSRALLPETSLPCLVTFVLKTRAGLEPKGTTCRSVYFSCRAPHYFPFYSHLCILVSDAILKTAFESGECKEERIVSSLLIYLGLLKVRGRGPVIEPTNLLGLRWLLLKLVIIKDYGVRSMIWIPGSLFFVMSSGPPPQKNLRGMPDVRPKIHTPTATLPPCNLDSTPH